MTKMSTKNEAIRRHILRRIREASPGLRGFALRSTLSTRQHRYVLKRMEIDGLVRFVPGAGWIEN